MTPTQRAELQSSILDRIKRTGTVPPTDADIADAAGVNRSLVSKWRNGSHEIGLSELMRLAKVYGAEVVWAPVLDESSADVVLRSARPAVPLVKALELAEKATSIPSMILRMDADGKRTADEVEEVERRIEEVGYGYDELRAGLKPGPRAVAR